MSNPVVSVCVPTYNGGAFLALTLKSIAAQTFEDYEASSSTPIRRTTPSPWPNSTRLRTPG